MLSRDSFFSHLLVHNAVLSAWMIKLLPPHNPAAVAKLGFDIVPVSIAA